MTCAGTDLSFFRLVRWGWPPDILSIWRRGFPAAAFLNYLPLITQHLRGVIECSEMCRPDPFGAFILTIHLQAAEGRGM